jgi:hypothetical protein
MEYTKPEILAVSSAIHTIQSGSAKPLSHVTDLDTDDSRPTTGAYEADE